MNSGKRIAGLLLAVFGLMFGVLGVATLIASLDRPMTFTFLGLFPYMALIVGGGMLFGGIKLFKSAAEPSVQPTNGTPTAKTPNWAGALAAIAVMAFGGWYYFGGGLETQANRNLQEIKDKVATDAVAQYGIAKRNGTAMDACVQAGMVAAAYLQAQNEPQYQQWKETEKTDCKKAGIEK